MGNANQRQTRERSAKTAAAIRDAAQQGIVAAQPANPLQQFMAAKMQSSLDREGRDFVKEEYVAIALGLNGSSPQQHHVLQLMEMTVPQLRQIIRSALVLNSSNVTRGRGRGSGPEPASPTFLPALMAGESAGAPATMLAIPLRG
jgi:hypothetical protein